MILGFSMKLLKTLFLVNIGFCFFSPSIASGQQTSEDENNPYTYEPRMKDSKNPENRNYRNYEQNKSEYKKKRTRRKRRHKRSRRFRKNRNLNPSMENQFSGKQNKKKFKSGSGVMMNLTSRSGDSVSLWTVPNIGETANSKLNAFSANLDIMYGFEFGLVLGATYFMISSKISKTDILSANDNYTHKTQLYGPTIGYYHMGGESATGLFTLFTYFVGGSCDDSTIAKCSVDSSYQVSLGWVHPLLSGESFTLAFGPQVNFIKTNFTNDQKIKMKRTEFVPLLALWFMW